MCEKFSTDLSNFVSVNCREARIGFSCVVFSCLFELQNLIISKELPVLIIALIPIGTVVLVILPVVGVSILLFILLLPVFFLLLSLCLFSGFLESGLGLSSDLGGAFSSSGNVLDGLQRFWRFNSDDQNCSRCTIHGRSVVLSRDCLGLIDDLSVFTHFKANGNISNCLDGVYD